MNKQQLYLKSLIDDLEAFFGLKHKLKIQLPDATRKTVATIGTESKQLLETAGSWASGGIGYQDTSNLLSVFAKLGLDNKGAGVSSYYAKWGLGLDKTSFPSEKTQPISYDVAALNADLQKLPSIAGEEGLSADNLLFIIQKHLAFAPSGYGEDVPFYDYVKMKAAIAVSLFENQGSSLLLVGGDVSGIQNFIYDIINRFAAKNLKGRSFYLQLLVNSVLALILKRCGLFSCNVVYDSGGKFYLIAPNTKEVKEILEALQTEVSRKIFDTHGTSLYMSLAYQEFSQDSESELSVVWNALNQEFAKKKQCRYAELLSGSEGNFFGELFEPSEMGGINQRDAITGDELSPDKNPFVYSLENDEAEAKRIPLNSAGQDQSLIKESTYQQIELGKALKSADYLLTTFSEISFAQQKNAPEVFDPCGLGVKHYLLEKTEWKNIDYSKGGFSIYEINSFTLDVMSPDANYITGFMLYGGNDYPTVKTARGKEPAMTFSEMAGMGESGRFYKEEFKEPKLKRLGVLRMDVDNLGSIFKDGMNGASLAKYAALSRSLDFFFKGYLNTLWKQEKYKESTQIIYAGGDDLFIVGRWSVVTDFAIEIQNEFQKWTCSNQRIGISGGIADVPAKYPIAKAADMAADFEKAAKDYKYPKDVKDDNQKQSTKNALCFLDIKRPVRWDEEMLNVVSPLCGNFKPILEGNATLANSLVHKVQSYHLLKEHQQLNCLTESWRWRMAYDLARVQERAKGGNNEEKEVQKSFVKQLSTDVFTDRHKGQALNSPHNYLDLLSLAARWAEWGKRSKSND